MRHFHNHRPSVPTRLVLSAVLLVLTLALPSAAWAAPPAPGGPAVGGDGGTPVATTTDDGGGIDEWESDVMNVLAGPADGLAGLVRDLLDDLRRVWGPREGGGAPVR